MLGSKARIAERVLLSIPDGSRFERWIEPFAGRGNVFFRVAASGRFKFSEALLNDENTHDFLAALRDYGGDFGFVDEAPINRDLHDRWERAPAGHERSLAQSYVCRMGGLFAWKSGVNTTCDRNTHSRGSTIARFERARAAMRSMPVLVCDRDWHQFVRLAHPTASDVVYFDPPYNVKQSIPYPNIDHELLLHVANTIPSRIMISGYPNELYEEHLTPDLGWHRREFTRTSTARNAGLKQAKPRVTEVVWSRDPNYDLER